MKKHLFLSLIALTLSSHVFAEIYKRVDADGRVTYSNIKSKGSTRLELDPDTNTIANDRAKATARSNNKRAAAPAGFPRIDKATQNQRDDKRKQILQNELATEEKALEEAKKNYAEGESSPEAYKTASGQTFRDGSKFAEKMKPLKTSVNNHQKNIELLQKELDSLR